MAKTMLSVRVDPELLERVDHYAGARGSSRSAVVLAALEAFWGGAVVPVLRGDGRSRGARGAPSAGRQGRVRSSGGPSSPGSASPAVSRPAVGDAPELVPLQLVVMRLERERFGSPAVGAGESVRVRRRIRLGRVQVAGKVVRDPAAMVDPSEVSL